MRCLLRHWPPTSKPSRDVVASVLVFDASPLNHFARAGELATLKMLTAGHDCVTTKAVIDELRRGVPSHPLVDRALSVDWVRIVPVDDLEVLYLFSDYMNRLGHNTRNAGEASVLAWAEANGAIAYVDDQVACNVARSRGVLVHRTLQLVVTGVRAGVLSEDRAQRLIESLADTDARFPTEARADLFSWARSRGLL